MALIRRTVDCEACGGSVSLTDEVCPYCGSVFESLIPDKHKLQSSKDNKYAADDAELLEPFIRLFETSTDFWPDQMDHLNKVLDGLKQHNYRYRSYIVELGLFVLRMRSIGQKDTQAKWDLHLEILKMLEAIHKSLTV